jgi:hypothetical protein
MYVEYLCDHQNCFWENLFFGSPKKLRKCSCYTIIIKQRVAFGNRMIIKKIVINCGYEPSILQYFKTKVKFYPKTQYLLFSRSEPHHCTLKPIHFFLHKNTWLKFKNPYLGFRKGTYFSFSLVKSFISVSTLDSFGRKTKKA